MNIITDDPSIVMSSFLVQQYTTGVQNEYINTNRLNFVNLKETMTGGEYEKVNMKGSMFDARSIWNAGCSFKYDRSKETEDFENYNWELGKEKDIVHLKNFVLEINNPKNYTLNQILEGITVYYGGLDRAGHIDGSVDLEITINTISKLLEINKPVQYKNGKIIVPIYLSEYIPYTSHSYDDIYITVTFAEPNKLLNLNIDPKTIEMELYCEKFFNYPKLEKYEALFFPCEFTGTEILQKEIDTHNIKLCYNHPTYILFIVGLDYKNVSKIQLILDGTMVYDETPLLQPNSNEPYIIFFNNDYLKNLQPNINLSRVDRETLVIKGVFEKDTKIDIYSLRFNTMYYDNRMYSMSY
jgi:hypothetical protein